MTDDNTDSDTPAEKTSAAKKTPKKKTAKKASKKATKKPAKKAPPRPKPPTTAALIKRITTLEEEVKKLKTLKAPVAGRDVDGDEDLETTEDGVAQIVAVSERVRTMHELLMGPMTTTIRKGEERAAAFEERVATFEERLNDCEEMILEKTKPEPEKDSTDADHEPA